MEILRAGSRPSGEGPADWFTGRVRIDPLFAPRRPRPWPATSSPSSPGARTDWHTHPLGQTADRHAGPGPGAARGRARSRRCGPATWSASPPGERHWHGAAPTAAMSHIAIQEAQDGSAVTWLEPVGDADYGA